MSNINYTEIVFKIKEEHIKFMKVTEDGSVHFTLKISVGASMSTLRSTYKKV